MCIRDRPGIAGIILSIGMGVDANVITSERIKEELRNGKTLDGAIDSGFQRTFSAIFDGNITMVIVAIILMGALGPPQSIFNSLLSPIFRWFGPSATGAIYSFGFTLIVGVIFNFIMGVTASRPVSYTHLALRRMGDRVRDSRPDAVCAFSTVNDGKGSILVVCGKDAVAKGCLLYTSRCV